MTGIQSWRTDTALAFIRLNGNNFPGNLQPLLSHIFVTDFSQPLTIAGKALIKNIQSRFSSEGPGWQELKPISVLLREIDGFSGKILDRTGILKGVDLRNITPVSVEVSTQDLPYAWLQQEGATVSIKQANVLSRPIPLSYINEVKALGYQTSRNKVTGQAYILLGHSVTVPGHKYMSITESDRQEILSVFKAWYRAHFTNRRLAE